MDGIAKGIVRGYIIDKINEFKEQWGYFEVFIVWKSKTLQNYKYMIGSTLMDGKYYEVTYNGDKKEWYLDVYEKVENKVIK